MERRWGWGRDRERKRETQEEAERKRERWGGSVRRDRGGREKRDDKKE